MMMMANRHPHLLPYNVLDTSSSSLNNNNNNPALGLAPAAYDSSSTSCRRIISSSVIRSITPTPPTTSSSSSLSSHCHCLRIYSLRHDPVHFIPALFAELNLPPPASIWSSSLSIPPPTDDSPLPPPPRGNGCGFGIGNGNGYGYEANSRALWFVYHDALAVRLFLLFTLFILGKDESCSYGIILIIPLNIHSFIYYL